MTEIDRLVYAAEAQIGTAEDPPGSNNIKYNTANYSHAVSGDAYPWCMVFVWWVFRDPWSFWQYTDQGKLEGYSGGHRYIDLNVMNRKESLENFMVKDSEAGR